MPSEYTLLIYEGKVVLFNRFFLKLTTVSDAVSTYQVRVRFHVQLESLTKIAIKLGKFKGWCGLNKLLKIASPLSLKRSTNVKFRWVTLNA